MAESIYRIQKKAEEGNASCQHEMGVNYQYCYGVPVDKQKCLEWFLKTAENGNAESMRSLGIEPEEGNACLVFLNPPVAAFDEHVNLISITTAADDLDALPLPMHFLHYTDRGAAGDRAENRKCI